MISRLVGTVLTYVVAGSLTVVVSIVSLVVNPVLRGLLILCGFPPQWSPFEWVPRVWATIIMFFFRRVMLMRLCVHGDLPRAYKNEHVVFIPNHGSSLEMFMWGWLAVKYFHSRVSVVVDVRNLTNPVGWALKGFGSSMFISREKPARAREIIRSSIAESLGPSRYARTIVIAPDGGRAKTKSVARDKEKYPEHAKWIGPVLFPHEAGFNQIIRGLEDANQRYCVVTATAAFGKGHNIGVAGLHRLFGSTIHLEAVDVTVDMPLDPTARRAWLVELWKRKSHTITEWRDAEEHYHYKWPALVTADAFLTLAALLPFLF